MTKYHKPGVSDDTYRSLQAWASYIERRTGKKISIAATIRWLATSKLTLKDQSNQGTQ